MFERPLVRASLRLAAGSPLRLALLLLVTAAATMSQDQDLTPHQSRDVFNAVGEALHQHFYDEDLNGVDWTAVKGRYLHRFEQEGSAQQLRDLLREVLNLLDASHTGVSSPEERALTSNILPFVFERIDGRVFVSGVLRPKSGSAPPVWFGDEILEVDGAEPSGLQAYSPPHQSLTGRQSVFRFT